MWVSHVKDEELREVLPALFLSISVATVVTIFFFTWFLNKFVLGSGLLGASAPVAAEPAPQAPAGPSAEIVTSLVADLRQQSAVLEQQRNVINHLQQRCNDLEGAFRDLKVRLGEPQVPLTYQATSPAPRSLRYSNAQGEL